jgi:hypothetical protein
MPKAMDDDEDIAELLGGLFHLASKEQSSSCNGLERNTMSNYVMHNVKAYVAIGAIERVHGEIALKEDNSRGDGQLRSVAKVSDEISLPRKLRTDAASCRHRT